MATGGIFQLITNDGKQDRMLMASALLKQRIEDATAIRRSNGDSDTTPTLYDIERTHILFTNAHFKPFAAIGYEYNKVSAQSGSTSLGSKIMFSIPQFGDFFNDMVVHVTMDQPTMGDLPTDPSKENLFRWCNYPGERLLKNVKFEVNGNPLDEYTSEATNFHREFSVSPNKKLAWNRCVGQEEDQVGYLNQPNWAASGYSASTINYRTQVVDNSGLQTPTGVKTDKVEFFIPLLFWCNKDPRLAVPSVAIPYGQRFITLELASQQELVAEYPRGYSTSASYDPWSAANLNVGGKLSLIPNVRIELYINNIFVNPEVHNIFIKRIGFSLIRVHRMQITEAQTSNESLLLQNLKWPIEALFVGMRMRDYNDPSSVYSKKYLDRWHRFSRVTDTLRQTAGWNVDQISITGELPYTTMALLMDTALGVPQPFLSATLDSVYPLNGPAREYTLTVNYTTAGGVVAVVSPHITPGTTLLKYTSGETTYRFLIESGVATAPTPSVTVSQFVYTLVFQGAVDGSLPVSAVVTGVTDIKTYLYTPISTPLEYTVPVYTPTLLKVTIKAHGIPIYNDFPAGFYNAYLPYNYGGANISAPADVGALMITFCLYPGTYQPSGHINVSRAREFYIEYQSSLVTGTSERGTLIVLASAINFLLISDGSAVLRYST